MNTVEEIRAAVREARNLRLAGDIVGSIRLETRIDLEYRRGSAPIRRAIDRAESDFATDRLGREAEDRADL